MKSKKLFSVKAMVAFFVFAFGITSYANNVQITGTSVAGNNITFNIAWENSWYASAAPANWDAVWVFVKYQDCNTKLWSHVNLNASGHSTSSPLQVDTVADNKGVFVRRSAVGGGNIAATSVTLSMNLPAGTYNFKVYGIEMVNIPQGAFQLGDNGTSYYTYNNVTVNAAGQGAGYAAATLNPSYSADVPATFPMGYNAFYCMKYEISQEQYADFLNSLTFTQQKNRVTTDPISVAGSKAMYSGATQYRNGLAIATPGSNGAIPAVFGCDATTGTMNGANDGQDVAMNFMSWSDLAAYLDWSALRPMTEMEFEKVCRGPLARISGEFPWGSTDFTNTNAGTVNNAFMNNEVSNVTVNNGMCVAGAQTLAIGYGPVRVGSLATGASGRLSAGAAYYGVMDMAGNVWERVVGTYYAVGTQFTGVLGNGDLDATGFADQANWPANTNAASNGAGYRGGDWYNTSSFHTTSGRYSMINVTDQSRAYNTGGRGVR